MKSVMKIKRSAILILALTIQYGYISPMQAQSRFIVNGRQMPLGKLLIDLGNSYNVYFTIEEGWKDQEIMNQLEAYQVQLGSPQDNLQIILEELRRTVPNFTFKVNQGNSRTIQIIDSRLTRESHYGLETVVKNINFTGTTGELVDELSKMGVSIQRPTLMDIHEARLIDFQTKVKVVGQGLTARDILTNCITLNDHGRILWIARTRLVSGEVSNIQFRH